MVYNVRYLRIQAHNVLTYKKLNLDLSEQGLVFITGSNGSGKSTIWALVEVALYGCTSDNRWKSDLTRNDKQGIVMLDFEHDGRTYRSIYAGKKSSWRNYLYEIIGQADQAGDKWSRAGVVMDLPKKKSGEIFSQIDPTNRIVLDTEHGTLLRDISGHNDGETLKLIADLIGQSQAEFDGSVHLTQGNQHTLISGKPKERKEYLSRFYGLDQRFDGIQEAADAEVKKLEAQIADIEKLELTLSHIRSEMSLIQVDEEVFLKSKEDKREIERLISEQEVLNRQFAEYESYLVQKNSLEQKFKNGPEEIEPDIDRLNKMIRDSEGALNQLAAIRSRNASRLSKNKKVESAATRFDELAKMLGVNVRTSRDTIQQEIASLKFKLERSARLSSLREQLSKYLNLPEPDTENYQPVLSKLLSDKQFHENKHKLCAQGQCPTCGQEVQKQDLEDTRSIVSSLQTKIDETMAKMAAQQSLQSQWQTRKNLEAQLEGVEWASPEDQDLLSEFTTLDEQLSEYEVLAEFLTHNLIEDMEVEPQTLPQIELDQLKSELRRLQEIQSSRMAYESLVPINPPIGDIMDLQKLRQNLSDLNGKLAVLESDLSRLERLNGQAKKMEVTVSAKPELTKQRVLYKTIVDAYGPKGLRLLHLRQILDVLVHRLPYYASLLFHDPSMSFSYKCDHSSVDLRVRRKSDQHNIDDDFDVAQMSGGEKRRVSVGVIVAQADSVTAQKRANMLILDEIDGMLDDEGEYLFFNELLPELRKKYESVFVISHAQTAKQATVFDKVWSVTKPNFWSQVEVV